MKARHLSLISKSVSLAFVLVAYIVTVCVTKTPLSGDQAWAIIEIGIFIAGIFVPVDISMIINAIKSKSDSQSVSKLQ